MAEIKKFYYYPKVEVEVSWTEVEDLISFSEKHYDYKCRELSACGALTGMRNRFDPLLRIQVLDLASEAALRRNATITVELDNDEVGLIAKCCENNDGVLLMKWMAIGRKLNAEYTRLNPRS